MIGVKINNRRGNDTDFVSFQIEDVNYIDLTRLKKSSELIPIYHTTNGEFAPIMTLRDLSIALRPKGFIQMDKSTIVNNKRIRSRRYIGTQVKITFVDFCELTISRRSRLK